MKAFAFALLLLLSVVTGSQGINLFGRFFENISPPPPTTTTKSPPPTPPPTTTTKPPPPTTTTTTKPPPPPPTTRSSTPSPKTPAINDNNCLYKKTKCEITPNKEYYRTLKAKGCPTKKEKCLEPEYLADKFVESFRVPGEKVKTGGLTSIVGKTLTFGPKKPTKKQECFQVTNKNNQLIAGNCNDDDSGSRRKRSTSFVQTRRDLLFMMDESASVGPGGFRQVRRIVVAVAKLLCSDLRYAKQYTRIAISVFNKRVELKLPLNKFFNNVGQLTYHILKYINYKPGYNTTKTCLFDALDHARESALANKNGGRRDNENVEQDIILITDGCENCVYWRNRKQRLLQELEGLKLYGIHIYVIGIKLRSGCRENLKALAQGGRCFHFFYLTSFGYNVEAFIRELENPPQGLCINIFERPDKQCLA